MPDEQLEKRIQAARLALLTAPERDQRARMLDLESLIKQRSPQQVIRMERAMGLEEKSMNAGCNR